MFIDSHAHIFLLNEKGIRIEDIILEMKNNNVNAISNICGNQDELVFSNSIADNFRINGINFFSVAGYHPHEASEFINTKTDWISNEKDSIIAVGEIGLDFHYNFSPREIQIKLLRKMIEVSIELKKPLIIHGRDGENEIVELLIQYGLKDKKVLFHCYTGDFETAIKIFENGWYISFSGIVTFNKSVEIQDILKNSPLNRILFETDSPFLAPTPFRGKINTPAKVRYIYEFVSKFLQIEVLELQKKLKENYEKIFNVKIL